MVWRRITLGKEIREATYFMNHSIIVYIPFFSGYGLEWRYGYTIDIRMNRILLHSRSGKEVSIDLWRVKWLSYLAVKHGRKELHESGIAPFHHH